MEEKTTLTRMVNDYQTPSVEIVEAAVETGFAATGGDPGGTGKDWGNFD